MKRNQYATALAAVTVSALLSACGTYTADESQSVSFSEEFKQEAKIAIVSQNTTAPFGLDWGDTEHAVKAKGIALYDCAGEDNPRGIRWCRASLTTLFNRRNIVTPYDQWERNAWYWFGFESYGHGLQAVDLQVAFRTTRDVRGEKGRRAFAKVKELMTEIYGAPDWKWDRDNSTRQGLTYYQCLEKETCGKLSSKWKTDYGYTDILLESAKNDDNHNPFYKKFGQLKVRWWTNRLADKYDN